MGTESSRGIEDEDSITPLFPAGGTSLLWKSAFEILAPDWNQALVVGTRERYKAISAPMSSIVWTHTHACTYMSIFI